MTDLIVEVRTHITEIGRLLFGRRLTDAAGGNISCRAGDLVCISPRYSGAKHHWDLKPENVLVCDLEGNKLEGDGDISREAAAHFRLLKDFPDGGAVIHAHPHNLMVFVMARQPMLPVLEATEKFGQIKVANYAPSHNPKLAEALAEAFQGQESAIRKQGAGVIAPWHGVFIIGKDLNAAFDTVERLDTQAYCLLMSRLIPGMENKSQADIHADLLRDLGRFKEER